MRQFFESDKRLGYAFSPYRRDVEVGWELLLDPWEVGLLKCVWKVCTHNPLALEQFPQEVLSHDPNVSGLVENHQFLKEQWIIIINKIKVKQSRKQILESSILPKNERCDNFHYMKLSQRSSFGRIEETINCFRDLLTFM